MRLKAEEKTEEMLKVFKKIKDNGRSRDENPGGWNKKNRPGYSPWKGGLPLAPGWSRRGKREGIKSEKER